MVKITETILRDAHQSLIATRMTTEQMLPIVEKLDNVGYNALEAWGGATFDASLRFLNEDPWERLRKIKDKAKKTPLQMLLRGQNILGYKHYADDVVDYFIQKAIANGMDIIRIFDALNDPRNIERAIKACIKEGGHAQGCICYTTSPYHSLEIFVRDAKRLEEMGANSICIKDMAGLLIPYEAFNLVKALKENVKVPKPQRGDILAVAVTGAYNYSMASNYNKVPRPAVVFVKDKKDYLGIKRETYQDLMKNDI